MTLVQQDSRLKDYVDEPSPLAKICYALVEYFSKDHEADEKEDYYTYENNTVEYCMHIFTPRKEYVMFKYKRLYLHSVKDGIYHYIAVFDRVVSVTIYLETNN